MGERFRSIPGPEGSNPWPRPCDPDQVLQSGSQVLVAAYGERDVLSIEGGRTSEWARGAAAVAIAPDPSLKLVVVAVNANE